MSSKKKRKSNEIEKVAKEAREAGLTYGAYMAKKLIEKQIADCEAEKQKRKAAINPEQITNANIEKG